MAIEVESGARAAATSSSGRRAVVRSQRFMEWQRELTSGRATSYGGRKRQDDGGKCMELGLRRSVGEDRRSKSEEPMSEEADANGASVGAAGNAAAADEVIAAAAAGDEPDSCAVQPADDEQRQQVAAAEDERRQHPDEEQQQQQQQQQQPRAARVIRKQLPQAEQSKKKLKGKADHGSPKESVECDGSRGRRCATTKHSPQQQQQQNGNPSSGTRRAAAQRRISQQFPSPAKDDKKHLTRSRDHSSGNVSPPCEPTKASKRSKRVAQRIANEEPPPPPLKLPKLHLVLTRKEIQEDWMKITGHKYSGKPKKSTLIQRGFGLCTSLTCPSSIRYLNDPQ